MAMWWLDEKGHSDTDGFQADATRQNWPWRDWVIKAFNKNMPFDQFTIEQFMGDLLPDATDEQRLATCFHRNHMHNGEGGRDPAESRVDYVRDRTNTTGTLWLKDKSGAMTTSSIRYPPRLLQSSAFFNTLMRMTWGWCQTFLVLQIRVFRPVEENERAGSMKAVLDQVKADAQEQFESELVQMIERAQPPYDPWRTVVPANLHSTEGTRLTIEKAGVIRADDSKVDQDDYFIEVPSDTIERITGVRLEVFSDPAFHDSKYSFAETGEFILTNVKLQLRRRNDSSLVDIPLSRATASVEGRVQIASTAEHPVLFDDDPRTDDNSNHVEPVQTAVFELADPITLSDDTTVIALLQRSLPRELLGMFRRCH